MPGPPRAGGARAAMTVEFEELDYRETPLGAISLRRRAEPRLAGKIVYEVKLGDEFLMSSLFTDGETALARLALGALRGRDLDIVVAGLGLGYTAAAALEYPCVGSLVVVEVMEAVIDWHRRGLVPLGRQLVEEPRCELVNADFFALVADGARGFHPAGASRRVDAALVDIDHSPRHWLNATNSAFYTVSGLGALCRKLRPGGVFGLWSNDPPDSAFMDLLGDVFRSCESHTVSFANPYTGGASASTVYLAQKDTAGEAQG